MIDDTTIDEIVRAIIDSELVFCKNHNLLMYLKFAMTIEKAVTIKKIDTIDISNSFDFESDDDSNVDDLKQLFH